MNCETCDHKQNPQGGHCYMFERQPIGWCGLHTMQSKGIARSRILGENMQALVSGVVRLVCALYATFKAFDH